MMRAFSSKLENLKSRTSRINLEADPEELGYNLLANPANGGVGLLVYARNDTVFNKIKYVETSHASCGFMNLMNNKGAVGVRLSVRVSDDEETEYLSEHLNDEEVLTFVNSHLAAHDSGILARNRDFRTIVNRLIFQSNHGLYTIYDSNHLFFMGDLNYRISLTPMTPPDGEPITQDILRNLLREDRHASLFPRHDTLYHQRHLQNVFVGLGEGIIKFKPTYKYKRGEVDEFVSFDHRLPGWTDRILFASWCDNPATSSDEQRTKVTEYQSIQEYNGSDHKPVFAVFEIPCCWDVKIHREFLAIRPRIAIDQYRKEKRLVGVLLDQICGIVLLVAVIIGFGNVTFGFINLGLALAFGSKWFKG